jgi:hypothetical protein
MLGVFGLIRKYVIGLGSEDNNRLAMTFFNKHYNGNNRARSCGTEI